MAKVKRIGKGCAVKCLPDKYVVVDIETTGLDPQSNEIIEISALKYEQNVLIDSYHTLVHPNESISAFITGLTGITNEMVSNARMVRDVFNDFADFIGDLVLAGYNNKRFDSSMLRRAGRYANRVINNKQFDLLPMAKKKTNLKDAKLNTVANYYGIENPRAHRAYADAITTAKLYLAIKQKYNGKQ